MPSDAAEWQKMADTVRDKNYGWAMYRLPGRRQLWFLAGPIKRPHLSTNDEAGFMVAPFENTENDCRLITPAIRFSIPDAEMLPAGALDMLPLYTDQSSKASTASTGYDEYTGLVSRILNVIKKQEASKIVAARRRYIESHVGGSLSAIYQALSARYLTAFVAVSSTPNFGTWVGCSPETLLHITLSGHFSTMSLAGTRILAEQAALVEHPLGIFSDKELREQQIVTHFLQNTLHRFSDENIRIEGPFLQRAGSLLHLVTRFKGRLKSKYVHDMLPLALSLHPTPAVAGMPREQVMKVLREQEGFDRKLYAGFWGPVRLMGESNLFVNLRCMQIVDEDHCILYAGAGIVEGSNPHNEWEETEHKMDTLLSVMKAELS